MTRAGTFISHAHLGLHRLEIIGLAGLRFSAHALSGPLFEPANSLVHVHVEQEQAKRKDKKK